MSAATHNGTCQACGNVQAVNSITGNIHKHGYTVDYGYFSGVCTGADRKPLEVERVITDRTIVLCNGRATKLEAMTVADIKKVPVHVRVRRNGFTDHDRVMMTEAEYNEHKKQWDTDFAKLQSNHLQYVILREAEGLRDHVEVLKVRIEERHGKELISREDTVERLSERFDKYAAAYERAEVLKAEGWKTRVTRARYGRTVTMSARKG
jgi:hypothetical protein